MKLSECLLLELKIHHINNDDVDLTKSICEKFRGSFCIDRTLTIDEIQWLLYREAERNHFRGTKIKFENILINNRILFRQKHGCLIISALFFDDDQNLIGGHARYPFDIANGKLKMTEIISDILYAGF